MRPGVMVHTLTKRQRQVDFFEIRGQHDLHNKFENSHIEKSCLKQTKRYREKTKKKL